MKFEDTATMHIPFPARALRAGVLAAATTLALLAAAPAAADPVKIRQVLQERFPTLAIDEVRPSPVPGIWEVRYDGSEILYSDAGGEHIFAGGSLIETSTRADLTERRIEQVLAVPWSALPLKDSLVYRQGKPLRRMAVFADPNCGFCKKFESDIAELKDVTIHVFVIPILGPDSTLKSRDILCARDPARAWREWMLEGKLPSKAAASCKAEGMQRNLAFSRQHRINGTPAVFLEDGTRRAGAIPMAQLEQLLAAGVARK